MRAHEVRGADCDCSALAHIHLKCSCGWDYFMATALRTDARLTVIGHLAAEHIRGAVDVGSPRCETCSRVFHVEVSAWDGTCLGCAE